MLFYYCDYCLFYCFRLIQVRFVAGFNATIRCVTEIVDCRYCCVGFIVVNLISALFMPI